MIVCTESDVSCSIRCQKCSKLTALSPYYTQNGIGFRIKNYARHIDSCRANPPSKMDHQQNLPFDPSHLMEKLRSEQRKNELLEIRLAGLKRSSEIRNGKNQLKKAKKNNESFSKENVEPLPNEPSALKTRVKNILNTQEILKNENHELKKRIFAMKNEFNDDLKKLKDSSLQSLSAEQVNVSNHGAIEVDKWRQKAENFQTELKHVQNELYHSQLERSNLLHTVMELKGKVRVMARLRPAKSSKQIKFELNSRRTELICELPKFNWNSFYQTKYQIFQYTKALKKKRADLTIYLGQTMVKVMFLIWFHLS